MTSPSGGPPRQPRYPFQRDGAPAQSGQPIHGHPETGQPAAGPSTYAQPAYGQPAYGHGHPHQDGGPSLPIPTAPWQHGQVPQPYPPQSHPGAPQGYPHQGYPQQAHPAPPSYPAQGFPSQGYPPSAYPQHGYPQQWGPMPGQHWGPPVKVDPRPTFPAVYQQLLRGPKHAWWRPLASLGLLVAGGITAMTALFIGLFVIYLMRYGDQAESKMDDLMDLNNLGAAGFLFTNLSLIALIPAVFLAIRVGHGMPIRYLWSVLGRWRWGWFARCLAVLTPLWIAYLALGYFSAPGTKPMSDEWVVLLILIATTTPFQCLAEELVFRGWFLTSIGSWFRNHVLGWIVPAVLSTAAFAAAHGSFDPWVLADLSVFAFTASFLCWWTGGLEAATAIHIVNNVLLMAFTVLIGEFGAGMISEETTGDWTQVAASLVVHVIALALVLWQAKRAGITRHYQQVAAPAPGQPSTPAPYPAAR